MHRRCLTWQCICLLSPLLWLLYIAQCTFAADWTLQVLQEASSLDIARPPQGAGLVTHTPKACGGAAYQAHHMAVGVLLLARRSKSHLMLASVQITETRLRQSVVQGDV